MLSAIDTNIISALWSKEPASKEVASLLFKCKSEGGLVIAAPVYAELLAYPKASKVFLDTFLQATTIQVNFDLNEKVWQNAGDAFAVYATRRRAHIKEHPKRLLVDFLIGAHALTEADRLLTLDKNRYQTSFPGLTMLP